MQSREATRRRVLAAGAAASAASVMPLLAARADDLEAKARAEKQLVWYTADSLHSAETVSKRFTQLYGIAVQINRKTTLPLVEQFVTESARGRSPADVFTTIGMGPMAGTLAEKKLLAEFVPRGAEKLPPGLRAANVAFGYTQIQLGVLYNTNMVNDEDVKLLRSYKGWLSPRFTGKIAIVAPTGGSTAGNTLMVQDREGAPFLETLIKQQKAVVYQSAAATADAVIAGEQAIGINLTPSSLFQVAAGAPVRFVAQDDWTYVVPAVAGVSATAPHPNAARLFMNWLFTPEAQKMHADSSYWIPVIAGVKPDYPKAPWLEAPRNPVAPEDSIAFDRRITASVPGWRKLFGW